MMSIVAYKDKYDPSLTADLTQFNSHLKVNMQ